MIALDQPISPDQVATVKTTLRRVAEEQRIITSALTTLKRAVAKNQITDDDYTILSTKYRHRRDQLERIVTVHQTILHLADLEATKGLVVQDFHHKLSDVTPQLETLRVAIDTTPATPARVIPGDAATHTNARFYSVISGIAILAVIAILLLYKYFTFHFFDNLLFVLYSLLITTWILGRFLSGYFYHGVTFNRNYTPSVSVVIPAYNEEAAIEHTIRSWMSIDYPEDRFEVIVVNDGSTDRTRDRVYHVLPEYAGRSLHFHTYNDNRGKRAAQKLGFDHAHGEIVIIADSDSFPATHDAVRHLIQPFQDLNVGGVCGQTDVSNVTTWLTKVQKIKYWTAFDRFKRSESLADGVTCLSGSFSAIRRVALDHVIDDWYTQTFLGKKTSYGDDRTLTTLLLKRGWNTVYVPTAKAKTIVPETFPKYWKQQLRWTKSVIRETYLGSKWMWRRPKIAFQFYLSAFFSFASFFIAIYTLYIATLLSSGANLPYIYLFGFIVVSSLYAVNYRVYNHDNIWIWAPIWSLMDTLVLVWKLPIALIELKNTKWGTR